MLKKFTNKDKRTNLDKEIDSILVIMTNMKEQLDNSNSENLDEQINSLLISMSQTDAASEDYLNMAKALDILYKAKANIKSKLEEYSEMVKNYDVLCDRRDKVKERKREVKKIAITGGFALAQLVLVLKHEDINVITSKAFSRLPWIKL